MARSHRIPRALSIRRRRRRQLARAAGSRHQHDGRRADRHPPHHRGEHAAACWSTRTPAGAARSTSRAPCVRSSRRAPPACTSKTRCSPSVAAIGPARKWCRAHEMVDRMKAAVDARTGSGFVIMARSDALASEGLDAMIERLVGLRRGGRGRGLPRGDHRPGDVPQGARRGAGAGAREHHRVRQDASVYARRAGRASASTSCCIAARPIAR